MKILEAIRKFFHDVSHQQCEFLEESPKKVFSVVDPADRAEMGKQLLEFLRPLGVKPVIIIGVTTDEDGKVEQTCMINMMSQTVDEETASALLEVCMQGGGDTFTLED